MNKVKAIFARCSSHGEVKGLQLRKQRSSLDDQKILGVPHRSDIIHVPFEPMDLKVYSNIGSISAMHQRSKSTETNKRNPEPSHADDWSNEVFEGLL